ncbi:TPR-like protein [Zopfia rhizophila CBS 207.26]|uniref:TPR-like protein n=1 Tax=Zopfia rhizophila CBS 207.26 TaxID=1314779 RepID=A0A6A6DQ87_9PEZI|nr:TPR-like protein [Zopfia rhizophila CBS 207.26]
MEKYLRDWRQDALNKHQYESAIFVGDKLLALTNDDKDAFWLAQVHFSTGNYNRAQSFLSRDDLIANNPSCRYLAAHCSIKLGKLDEALSILGDKNPTHLISAPGSARTKLRHVDIHPRAGGRHQKTGSRTDRVPTSEERDKEDAANLKFEAAMCYLRGVCYAKQNSFDRAKECYKVAVQIDVQCFEAFDQLMTNSLMSPDEEWKFLESLNFDTINVNDNSSLSQEAAEFTKTLYTTRLSKYSHPEEFTAATETLSTHYNLASNPDILLSKADLLFTQCRFRSALALTSSILQHDKYNFTTLPTHLACLHELSQKNALFLLAHDLADTHPQEPCAWLAIGIYYLSISRIAEARRYFSKASMMDPHFGPAWIGFAHTFAAEGEHDQAISAYSTAARLFQGTHLPQLFLGMQNLQLNNLSLAHEYLNTAYDLCKTDPLLLNEMGVVYYHEDALKDAITMFSRALDIAKKNDSDKDAWLPTRTNLAHALRRNGQLKDALVAFDEVLRNGGKDAGVFTAKGLVLMEMSRYWDAVVALHEALAVAPQDPMATDLLNRALEVNESESVYTVSRPMSASDEEVDELDRRIEGRLREIQQNTVAGRGGRRGRRVIEEVSMGDSMMVDSDEG